MPNDPTPPFHDSLSAPPAADAGAWWRWGWLWPPVAVGVFLRLFRLPSQLLLADELHAPRAAQRLEMGEILTTYLPSDNSMPLTAFYELLLENGVVLTELHLRLPVLLAGMLALVVLPVAVARRLGGGAGRWMAWLVALSPGLVLYGRIVRSYMPVVLLAFLAAMAFERWWRTRRPGAAVGYAGFGAAAVWFHLGAAPFVAAPLAWGAAVALVRPRPRAPGWPGWPGRLRELAAVSAVGLGLAAGLALFLVPARESFLALFGDKAGHGHPPLAALPELLTLHVGAARGWAALLFWAVALLGLAVLLRRRPGFASYTLVLVAVSPLAVAWMQPLGWSNPMIFNRYLLVGLPLVLLWGAVGLARLGEGLAARLRERRGRPVPAARWALPAVFLVLWVAGGPWSDWRVLYSSFLHGNGFLRFTQSTHMIEGVPIPPFFERLAEAPGEQPVVAFTALPTWISQAPVEAYQDVHRQPVLLAPEEDELLRRLEPRNYVDPGAAAFLDSRARWLVIHRRPTWELDRVRDGGGRVWVPEPLRPMSRRIARRLGGHLERRWGPPDYQDMSIQAWDLDRVRRSLREAGEAGEAGGSPLSPAAAAAG